MAVMIGGPVKISSGVSPEKRLEVVSSESIFELRNFEERLERSDNSHLRLLWTLDHGLRYDLPRATLRSWDYRTRASVAARIPEISKRAFLAAGVIEVPAAYHEVARWFNRLDYFSRLHVIEGQARHVEPPVKPDEPEEPETEENEEEWLAYREAMAVYIRELPIYRERATFFADPKRPDISVIEEFFAPKIRTAVISLLGQEEWIDDPDNCSSNVHYRNAIADLNDRMRSVDLGRNKHLNFSSNPGKVWKPGPRRPDATVESAKRHPFVLEWLEADPTKRLELQTRNPLFLPHLLRTAGIKFQPTPKDTQS